jgi:subfamily B ATP-binding cassette protein MsbA
MDESSLSRREKLRGIRRILAYRPRLVGLILGLSLVSAAFGGFGLSFILPIVELAQSSGPPTQADGLLGVFVRAYRFVGVPLTLETAVLGVAIVMTVRHATSFLVAWLRAVLQQDYVRHLRRQAFERTLSARTAYYDRNGSDEVINAVITQADYAGGFVKNSVRLIEAVLVVIVFTTVAFVMSPGLTLLTAVVFAFITVLTRTVFARGDDIGDRIARANERVQEATQAGIQGIRDVKLFRLESEFLERFRTAVDESTRLKIQLERSRSGLGQAFQLMSAVTVFVLLYLGLAVFTVPLSELAVFLFAMFRLAPQVSSVNDLFFRAEGDLPHAIRTERFVDTLEARAEPRSDSAELTGPVSTIEFDDVSFGYGEERVLDDVSLEFSRGEFIGLVGQSGAGKSTVAMLLARLYAPDEGAIYADGVDIQDVDIRAWRGRVSVVRQQPWIFSDTLYYNLTVGARDSSREEVERACEIAQVTEFLGDLPDGFETELGDDGVRLSGGQRQRVAIARALLKDADVLVLDEATSDLDTHLERRVHDAIESADSDYATVAIAHRLSTIRDADRIYTFTDGRITETGTHGELLERGGTYANLHATQTNEV